MCDVCMFVVCNLWRLDMMLYSLLLPRTHTRHTHTGQIPVTVVLTESNIYLACENFHQWPLPRLQELPPRETLEPPFSDVHCKDISDIEQIVSCPIQYTFLCPSFSPVILSFCRFWTETKAPSVCSSSLKR